jgi:hypothetical protein
LAGLGQHPEPAGAGGGQATRLGVPRHPIRRSPGASASHSSAEMSESDRRAES